MTSPKIIKVVAAVIERPDGSFLLGQRAVGSFYPGYWEFPGGKIEAGETAQVAIARELKEELGITVERADPWLRREHVYEHGHVKLQFFRVRAWHGDLQDHVHSALAWQHPATSQRISPMLPANGPVLAALALPTFYAITHAAACGIEVQLRQLEQALKDGLRLVQLREPQLDATTRASFVQRAVGLCHRHGAQVLVSGDAALACETGADGLHLPARLLIQLTTRPDFSLVAASCHNAAELEQAARLGCDFAVFGPVKASASHPDRVGIGWDALARELEVPPLPVFALGGLSVDDLDAAQRAGAHGIAAIRAAWN